jgi:hypothetical protein
MFGVARASARHLTLRVLWLLRLSYTTHRHGYAGKHGREEAQKGRDETNATHAVAFAIDEAVGGGVVARQQHAPPHRH